MVLARASARGFVRGEGVSSLFHLFRRLRESHMFIPKWRESIYQFTYLAKYFVHSLSPPLQRQRQRHSYLVHALPRGEAASVEPSSPLQRRDSPASTATGAPWPILFDRRCAWRRRFGGYCKRRASAHVDGVQNLALYNLQYQLQPLQARLRRLSVLSKGHALWLDT